jgi:hypothetical protein
MPAPRDRDQVSLSVRCAALAATKRYLRCQSFLSAVALAKAEKSPFYLFRRGFLFSGFSRFN